jgi:hypothetical protein
VLGAVRVGVGVGGELFGSGLGLALPVDLTDMVGDDGSS